MAIDGGGDEPLARSGRAWPTGAGGGAADSTGAGCSGSCTVTLTPLIQSSCSRIFWPSSSSRARVREIAPSAGLPASR